MCAAPTPFFGRGAQSGNHRVAADVAANPDLLVLIANQMVVGFMLPESFADAAQEQICLACSVTLSAAQNIAESVIWHRPENKVNMIRHDHPIIENILSLVEMKQCFNDHFGDLRTS